MIMFMFTALTHTKFYRFRRNVKEPATTYSEPPPHVITLGSGYCFMALNFIQTLTSSELGSFNVCHHSPQKSTVILFL